MAGRKKLLAIGLAAALAVPTMAVYAQDSTTTKKDTEKTYTIAEQEIKNKSEAAVGKVVCTTTIDTTNTFVKEIELTAAVLNNDGKALEGATYTWADPSKEADEEASKKAVDESEETNEHPEKYTVTKNGTYTVTVDLSQITDKPTEWILDDVLNLKVHPIKLSVVVENIDVTGPVIQSVTKTPTDWTKDSVTVTVTCADEQPETTTTETQENTSGTMAAAETKQGAGLHTQAYSFDGGKTWTAENTTTVTENKNIDFVVRDALGNQTKQTIEITNIDKTAPMVSLAVSDGVLYEGEEGIVTLTATASDAESGLAEKAYSWDYGKSWYSSASATVPTVGTFSVMVRDKVGNMATASVEVTYTAKPNDGNTNNGGTNGGTTNNGNGSTGGGTTNNGNGSTGGGTTNNGNGGTNGGTANNGNSSTNNENNITTGNSSWENNNSYVSGTTSTTERETSNTETKETKKETDKDKEKETKETKKSKETKDTKETKEVLQTPGTTTKKDGSGFPLGIILIAAAILIVLSIIILVIKLMLDRRMALIEEDDDEDEDMSKVYARVHKEAAKTIEAAAATAAVNEAADTSESITSEEDVDLHADMDIEAVIGASVAEAIADEAPVVKKIKRNHHEAAAEDTPHTEDEISIGEFAAAAVAAGIAVVDDEKEMEAAISEMEEEKATHVTEKESDPENVVIEGEHSRLIIDPETGEYTYEFK